MNKQPGEAALGAVRRRAQELTPFFGDIDQDGGWESKTELPLPSGPSMSMIAGHLRPLGSDRMEGGCVLLALAGVDGNGPPRVGWASSKEEWEPRGIGVG